MTYRDQTNRIGEHLNSRRRDKNDHKGQTVTYLGPSANVEANTRELHRTSVMDQSASLYSSNGVT